MESFDATYRGNRTAGTCRQLDLRGGDAHWFALQYGGEERIEAAACPVSRMAQGAGDAGIGQECRLHG